MSKMLGRILGQMNLAETQANISTTLEASNQVARVTNQERGGKPRQRIPAGDVDPSQIERVGRRTVMPWCDSAGAPEACRPDHLPHLGRDLAVWIRELGHGSAARL